MRGAENTRCLLEIRRKERREPQTLKLNTFLLYGKHYSIFFMASSPASIAAIFTA